ncbi:MAG: EAL domain-containing protein [Pontibacterium sp.]
MDRRTGVVAYDEKKPLAYGNNRVAKTNDIPSVPSDPGNLPDSITRELALHRSLLSQYKNAVDNSAIVSKADSKGIITYVNDEFCRVSGYSREQLIGATHALIRHPDTPLSLFQDMWKTISGRKIWKGLIKNRNQSGSAYHVDTVIVPLLDDRDCITEFMSIRNDVTSFIEQESIIERQLTDPMTLLPNRQKLLNDLEESRNPSLLLINISDFSVINEYYGYKVGDKVLQAVAVQLKKIISSDMTLYRLAGDEFVVVSPNFSDTQKFSDYCALMCKSIAGTALKIDQQEFLVHVVIGGASGDNAYIEADIALHSAQEKQLPFEIFDQNSQLKQRIETNIRWVGSVREAIHSDRIEVYAQPIINAKSGEITKYECLMRLKENDGTVYTPYFFLEPAKRARLYNGLTQILIHKAFSFFSDRPEDFSINLTARDILSNDVVALILTQAVEHNLASRLILEIVESEGIENYEQVSRFISQAKAIGCRIAVDDFGTGYSNFEYLLKLDIDFIKVDGSLIRHLDTDPSTRLLAETIVIFGQRLGVVTVAEFVHNEKVKDVAIEVGFDFLQGYFLGEPVPLSLI